MSITCGGSRSCTSIGSECGVGGRNSSAVREAAAWANGAPQWKDDKSSTQCESCEAKFTMMTRRHHCRLCGRIFCANCSSDKRPIPRFDYMQPVRVCRHCSQLCWKSEALLLAIRTNDIETVSRYVKANRDCNFYIGVFPPLSIAAADGLEELTKLLIEGKANVKHAVPACVWFSDSLFRTDHIGVTALHAAVQGIKGNVGVVKALLDAKADVDARTHKGNTPLLFAANSGQLECARLLIDRGACVNAQNNADGESSLHRAVREGHVHMSRLLVVRGANVHLVNQCGLSPLQLADRLRLRAVLDALTTPIACGQEPLAGEMSCVEVDMSRDSILSPAGMGISGGERERERVDMSMGSVLEMGYDEDGSEEEDGGVYGRENQEHVDGRQQGERMQA